MGKIPVSVIILTKNSQKYIKEVLNSLCMFDEVIIVDNGSQDDTLNMAKKFKNVKIVYEKFTGFGPLKNKSMEYASNEWVLFVDSDEIVKKEMAEFVKNIDYSSEECIYSFLRDNYYKKELINCCGWENDYVMRLFNKKHTKFNDNKVHESLIVKPESKIIKTKKGLKHYSFDSIEELINKMQLYSTLFAEESAKKATVSKAVLSAGFKFIKNYFFQKGFLYGYKGLVISASNANGVFYKYMKLYERLKNENGTDNNDI